jgi:hypothetical protein
MQSGGATSPTATNRARRIRATVKESDMLRLLMAPANAVCDVMRVDDEGERAVIRMLVNMLLLSFVSVMVFVVAIEAV